jgi:uncharacterized membrane protein HdeD (DUF308 family)
MYKNTLKADPFFLMESQAHDRVREIQQHHYWYSFEGLLFISAGVLAISLPGITAVAAGLVVSAALCIGGLMRLLNAARFHTGRGWRLLSGAIFLAAGGSMLWWPVEGINTLVLIMGAFLFAEGFVEIFLSLSYRPLFHWGALLISGLMSLILGTLIFTFPITGIVFIALAIGLSMIFHGLSLLVFTWKGTSPRAS